MKNAWTFTHNSFDFHPHLGANPAPDTAGTEAEDFPGLWRDSGDVREIVMSVFRNHRHSDDIREAEDSKECHQFIHII